MSESKPVEESKEPVPAPAVPETETPTEDTVADASSSDDHVGKRVAKKFGKKLYFGVIKEKWTEEKDGAAKWHVKYDDGDEEDFNEKELDSALNQYEEKKRWDFKVFPRKPRKPSEKKRKFFDSAPARTSKFPKRG
jgi:hypothetical protein